MITTDVRGLIIFPTVEIGDHGSLDSEVAAHGGITRMETKKTSLKINLKDFERSPRLSEIRAVYKSGTKAGTRKKISNPSDVTDYLHAVWNQRTIELTEDFIVLYLNTAHEILGWVKISSGGLSCTSVDPRVIFAIALQTGSSALVLAHNHPSGNLTPSYEDQEITKKLAKAGTLLNIKILDHIILSKDSSFSFSEHGQL